MSRNYIIPVALFIIGTILVVKGIRLAVLAFGLRNRGIITTARFSCLEEHESGFDRHYVSFSLEGGEVVNYRLKNTPKYDLKNGDLTEVVYDSKKPKRVVLNGENIHLYMSTASFMIGLSMFLYNMSASLLLYGKL